MKWRSLTFHSSRLIHNWWKVPKLARILPPIHAPNLLSTVFPGAWILTWQYNNELGGIWLRKMDKHGDIVVAFQHAVFRLDHWINCHRQWGQYWPWVLDEVRYRMRAWIRQWDMVMFWQQARSLDLPAFSWPVNIYKKHTKRWKCTCVWKNCSPTTNLSVPKLALYPFWNS